MQGCIKLIKNDSNNIYNDTKNLYCFKIPIHERILNESIMVSTKNIKQH